MNQLLCKILSKNGSKTKLNRICKSILSYSTESKNNNELGKSGCCKVTDNLEKEMVKFGQPTYWTHPNLFDPSSISNQDVTPGISKQEFEKRRDRYVEYLTNYQKYCYNNKKQSTIPDVSYPENNFIAIIPSCMTSFMAPDVPHTFKQNSDFLYLTGFKEPNSLLVISRTTKDNNSYKSALFVREKDPKKEVWEGAFTGSDNVKKLCGIEHAFGISEFEAYILSLLKENENKKIVLWRYPTESVIQESGPNCYNQEDFYFILLNVCIKRSRNHWGNENL